MCLGGAPLDVGPPGTPAAGYASWTSTLNAAAAVIAEVRRAKTEAKASLRAEVAKVTVRDTSERLAALRAAEADVTEAGHIAELTCEASDTFTVGVDLASG